MTLFEFDFSTIAGKTVDHAAYEDDSEDLAMILVIYFTDGSTLEIEADPCGSMYGELKPRLRHSGPPGLDGQNESVSAIT